jgi:hypothetical protein
MQLRFSIPGFRKRIEDKIKVLSIRQAWSNGKGIPEVGETLKLKDGSRWIKAGMPGCLRPILVDGKNPVCSGVWPVRIYRNIRSEGLIFLESFFFSQYFDVFSSTLVYNHNKNEDDILNQFAIMDGWNNFSEMFEFFKLRLPLDAFIISWEKR